MLLEAGKSGDFGVGQDTSIGRALGVCGQNLCRHSLLALEVVVERSFRNPRRIRDVLDATRVEPSVGEQSCAGLLNDVPNAVPSQEVLLPVVP